MVIIKQSSFTLIKTARKMAGLYRRVPSDICTLPQYDDDQAGRRKMLQTKQKRYVIDTSDQKWPAEIKSLPPDEAFSHLYKLHLGVKKILDQIQIWLATACHGKEWKGFADLKSVYGQYIMPLPTGVDRWTHDAFFGWQRLNGVNPTLIKRCREIDDIPMKLDQDKLRPLMENMSLEEAILKHKLYVCNMSFLQLDIHCFKPKHELCAPVSLFFHEVISGQLKPVAIQLFQKPAPSNPVFYPSDDPWLWTLVKMWYNNADSAYHQAVSHLLSTHLMMEGFAVVTHRQLSTRHPLFKLLAPHFQFIFAINLQAKTTLLGKNGAFDTITNIGITRTKELVKNVFGQWNFQTHCILPSDLETRGLEDKSILPCYHFRNDAMLIYKAIHKYVKSYVSLYYDNYGSLSEDVEIQAWVEEIIKDRAEGGCGLKGLPLGPDSKLTDVSQLITILTGIIYTCSVGHAAVNFPQYNAYCFPANYPLLLRGTPPKSKDECKPADILKALPDRPTTLAIMDLASILSFKDTTSLGDFEDKYITDEKALSTLNSFRDELFVISKIIKERKENLHCLAEYKYLDPERVPNAISI